jgi:hypothetical protein
MRHGFLLLVAVLCLGSACTDVGLGVPGAGAPLPAGGLPASQTLEGGAQIRISQPGLVKLTSTVPGVLDDAIDRALCVAEGSVSGSGFTTDYCYTSQGSCTRGCSVAIDLAAPHVAVSVENQQTLHVRGPLAAIAASVPLRGEIFFIPFSCNMALDIAGASFDADVALSIDPASGVLGAHVASLDLDLGTPAFSGCSVIADIAPALDEIVDGFRNALILDVIRPALDDAIARFLPGPQELAALVDLPGLALTGPGSSNGSAVETRIVPGGYVTLQNDGLSLGIVTGFNSDADPGTRAVGQASEPHPCVPALVAPDLSQPPASLAISPRGTFALPPADTFLGIPEPLDDLQVGVSRTALDLAGHHIVASGGMCLRVEADRAPFIRRDVLDDLLGVPLGAGDDVLRLVVKPQHGVAFEIGTGSEPSPHITAVFDDLRIDVESATTSLPLLRLSADVRLGLQLEPRHDAGLPARLEATRASLGVVDPGATAFDVRYAGLNAAELDALAGTVADVVFATLGADAGIVLLSSFAGFELANVGASRLTTASDDFLAVTASLGAFGSPATPAPEPPAPTPQPLSTTLSLPAPAALRAALLAGNDAGLPAVHVELPTLDGARPLEHAWRTAGGPWHPYAATGDLVIRDRSFAWQGERTIELRSRVVGDDGTTSGTGSITVTIDWSAPTLFADQATIGDFLVVPARDAVDAALEWALGRVGESVPATDWISDPDLDLAAARALGDDVVVYVRDAAGHVAQTIVHVPEPNAAAAAALACAALAVIRARRTRRRLGRPAARSRPGGGRTTPGVRATSPARPSRPVRRPSSTRRSRPGCGTRA